VARTKSYDHFCAIARSLEIVGEKWTLLIVRDLLRGPQRFSDLRRFMGGITPKWLTNRLRELEAEGIVERDSVSGRREVWYRLTPKGRDLAPVLESLTIWGINHAMRPPEPGEALYPEVFLQGTTTYLNSRGLRLPSPSTWVFRFDAGSPVTIRFDGERWSATPGESEADLVGATTAADLLAFLMARVRDRAPLVAALHLEGSPEALAVFRTALVREPASSARLPRKSEPQSTR